MTSTFILSFHSTEYFQLYFSQAEVLQLQKFLICN